MSDDTEQNWSLTEEMGGAERLDGMVREFYERLMKDPMIGFMFHGKDLDRLVDKQIEYVRARLGTEEVEYTGMPIRSGHQKLPILPAHFDRRHHVLVNILEEWEVPEHVREAWVDLEDRLRDLIVQTGGEARDEILNDS